MTVTLQPLDRGLIAELLSVALAEATPEEVMPPVAGPPGWTEQRRAAFLDFYHSYVPADRTTMFAIVVAERVRGMIRLAQRDEPGVVETGIWLGRSSRGQGIGAAALAALIPLAAATGAHTLVADTSPDNAAALAVLRRHGGELNHDADGRVRARLPLHD